MPNTGIKSEKPNTSVQKYPTHFVEAVGTLGSPIGLLLALTYASEYQVDEKPNTRPIGGVASVSAPDLQVGSPIGLLLGLTYASAGTGKSITLAGKKPNTSIIND